MAHPEAEAVSDNAGSPEDIFGRFIEDAPDATAEDLAETPEGEEPSDEDSGEPEEVDDTTEEVTEEADSDEPQPEAIDPPHSWSKEDKAFFKSLPPETQRIVAERERQRDGFLSQRAEALAIERKEIEALQAEAEKTRREYAERLSQFQPKLPDPPDETLIDSDPITYMKQQRAYEAAVKQQQESRAELERLSREHQEQQQKAHQEYLAKQQELLPKYIPEMADETKAAEIKKSVAEYALKTGYVPEQLQGVSALDVMVLNKARLYDEMMAKGKTVPEKLKDVPPVVKPGQRRSKTEAVTQKHQEQMAKLKKTGRLEDAAAVFRDLI
jgi:hypothetical protein